MTWLQTRCARRGLAAVLFVSLLSTSVLVECRRGCVDYGCSAGFQCDTSYDSAGNCVQKFNDNDINQDEATLDVEDFSRLLHSADLEAEKQLFTSPQLFTARQLFTISQQQEQHENRNLGDGEDEDGDVEYTNDAEAEAEAEADSKTEDLHIAVDKEANHAATAEERMASTAGLSACQKKQHTETVSCGGGIGCLVSQCEADGSFSSPQCHASTGYCWCVDAEGKKVVGTDTAPGTGTPNCAEAPQTTPSMLATAIEPSMLAPVESELARKSPRLETDQSDLHEEEEDRAQDSRDLSELEKEASFANQVIVGHDGDAAAGKRAPAAVVMTTSSNASTPASARTHNTFGAGSIFLWIIIACCIAFAVSIPLLLVCVCQRFRRKGDEPQSYVVVKHTSSNTFNPGEKELVERTARRSHHGSVSSTSEKSLVLPAKMSADIVTGHMEIGTGHTVLAYLEEHIRNPQMLSDEWQGVAAYEAEDESTSDARTDFNTPKNRYGDILPYNNHRVQLDASVNASRSNYINASTICDRSPHQAAYLATQGPLDLTVADFWQMVWEQGSRIIVMLTKLHDGGITQCHRYWPEKGVQIYHMFEVRLVSEHNMSDDYCVRSFYVVNRKTKETRTVTQYQFLSWPNQTVPKEARPLLEFRRRVKKSFTESSAPIVVHDNAGVGRAGCYILIDMLLNRLADSIVKEIDMAASVEHLRDQRMKMVQTEEQFRFAYTALVVEVRAILDAMPR